MTTTLLQTDSENAEDHAFLRSACHRFGLRSSKPGNVTDEIDLSGLEPLIAPPSSPGNEITVRNATRDQLYSTRHRLSGRQIAMLPAGGLIPWPRERKDQPSMLT